MPLLLAPADAGEGSVRSTTSFVGPGIDTAGLALGREGGALEGAWVGSEGALASGGMPVGGTVEGPEGAECWRFSFSSKQASSVSWVGSLATFHLSNISLCPSVARCFSRVPLWQVVIFPKTSHCERIGLDHKTIHRRPPGSLHASHSTPVSMSARLW